MMINKAFELIEKNIELSDFSGPIDVNKLAVAEEILGISFPKSYSKFLESYGAGDINGVEIFGIINDPVLDGPMIPNGIWMTKNLREEINLSPNYLVISETGYGSYYVIDTSQKDENLESPVYLWDSNNTNEKVADSFNDFLILVLAETGLSA